MGSLDFSLAPSVLYGLLVGGAFPLCLAIICRLPQLSGHNALQFLIGFLTMTTLWGVLAAVWPGPRPPDLAEIAIGLMALGAGVLFYLEVWALLSRGYTLGLLVTLYNANRPLDEEELARSYRGGSGLSWIMQHRLSGLIGAGLVRQHGGMIILTPVLGVPVAWLFKLSIMVLGLRRAG